jgi:hypothetical protein
VPVLVLCASLNHHTKAASRKPIAASWRGAHRPPYLFLAAWLYHSMKVADIGKITTFRNFIFQKSAVIVACGYVYQHLRRLFFSSDFDMSKKTKK